MILTVMEVVHLIEHHNIVKFAFLQDL